jgi:hypothetical protein
MRFRESLEVLKLYKREERGGSRGSAVSVTLRCRISDLTDLLVRSWDFPTQIGVVARPCEASWELDVPSGECVAPLRLKGLRGKQSTPSIG